MKGIILCQSAGSPANYITFSVVRSLSGVHLKLKDSMIHLTHQSHVRLGGANSILFSPKSADPFEIKEKGVIALFSMQEK